MLYPQSQMLLRNSADLKGKVLLVDPMADELAGALAGIDLSVWCTDAAVAQAYARANTLLSATLDAPLVSNTPFDTVVIFYPKAKDQLAYMLAELTPVISPNTEIYLVGDNKGGIKGLAKQVMPWQLHAHKLDNAKHCLWFALSGLTAAPLPKHSMARYQTRCKIGDETVDLAFCSLPGVFNHGRLDVGTAQLLATLGDINHGRVLDFACGAGIIAAALKQRHPAIELWATDICALAIASTAATLALQGFTATLRCQDGITADLPKFNHIVSNPPFHTGLKLDLAISQQFIADCKTHLLSGGTLTLVANAHLPYGQWLTTAFGDVKELSRSNGFVVWQAMA